MKVTAVIPSYYEADHEYLKLCVESLRETVNWDIIVVTNGTPHKPTLEFGGVTRHVHTRDQGQCVAVNIGAQLASPDTDYLFVINSDMYFAPDWKQNLEFKYPVFSPNLIEPTDNAGSAPPFLKLDGGLTIEAFKKDVVDNFVKQNTEYNVEDPTTGFNLPFFIKLDVWRTIGGYDPAYDPWGSNSDTDLQTAVELAGIQPMRLRNVLVYHFSNKSGTFDGSHQEAWWKNWFHYTNKWGFNRDMEPIPDTWMATNLVNREKLIYHPDWEGKYAE